MEAESLDLASLATFLPSDTSTTFTYESLPAEGNPIRLFELYPGDALRGRLIHTRLYSNPGFEALSYTWGDSTQTESIECNGRSLRIGLNLARALRRLRHQDQRRLLWADALCIDQDNDEERAQQVQQMHEVYASADRVVVDLGEDENGLAVPLFKMMQELVHHYEPLMSQETIPLRAEDKKASAEKMKMLRAFFMDLPWFFRVWVQQEIALAKTAVAHWGTESIAWIDLLSYVLIEATLAYWHHAGSLHIQYAGPIVGMLTTVWAAYGRVDMWLQSRPTFQVGPWCMDWDKLDSRRIAYEAILLLNESRGLHATEAKDHVYAFQGHPAIKRLLALDVDSLATVDYKTPAAVLFFNLAKVLLTSADSLDPLLAVINGTQTSMTSSWVPDWSKSGLEVARHMLSENVSGDDPWDTYDAARTKRQINQQGSADSAFTLHDNILRASGVVVDRLKHVVAGGSIEHFLSDPSEWVDGDEKVHITLRFWRAVHQHLSLETTPYDSWGETFIQTLSVGMDFDRNPIEPGTLSKLPACRAFFEQQCRFPPDVLAELFPECPSSSPIDWSLFAVQLRYSFGRNFFLTEKGYMGLGGTDIAVGDELCVLFDATIPVILRPMEEAKQYRLSGECFVEGLMQGQAVDMMDEGKLVRQYFDIV